VQEEEVDPEQAVCKAGRGGGEAGGGGGAVAGGRVVAGVCGVWQVCVCGRVGCGVVWW